MNTYEVFQNGKVEIIEAVNFVEMSRKKAICLRFFKGGEVQWTSPDYERYTSVATRLKRNEKINELFS